MNLFGLWLMPCVLALGIYARKMGMHSPIVAYMLQLSIVKEFTSTNFCRGNSFWLVGGMTSVLMRLLVVRTREFSAPIVHGRR